MIGRETMMIIKNKLYNTKFSNELFSETSSIICAKICKYNTGTNPVKIFNKPIKIK